MESTKEWSTGLCGWCTNIDDCEFCCIATWCGCIAYGMNTALMEGHRGYSKCCCNFCDCPQSCECQYCGDACCLYAYISSLREMSSNNFRGNNGTELIIALICTCASACVTNAFLGFLTYKQVKAVGQGRGIYKDHLPIVCCCFDAPCCESFWCGPCVLTRVHHEVLKDFEENGESAKRYEYNIGTFKQVNSMFDNVKIK